jgi:hypothetical protein
MCGTQICGSAATYRSAAKSSPSASEGSLHLVKSTRACQPVAMVFTIAQVRSPDDPEDELFPLPGPTPNSVVPLLGEGAFSSFKVEGIWTESKTNGETTELGQTGEVKAELLVSDQRVAIACTHFQNGGGWHGYGTAGAAFAVIANGTGNAVAHNQTRGTSLVGHVRHEWIVGVIARDRKGWGSNNYVEILLWDPPLPGSRSLSKLHVQLDRKTLASPAAQLIASRAASVKAAVQPEGSLRDSLLTYAQSPVCKVLATTGARTYSIPMS